MAVEEIRGKISDQPLRHQGRSVEFQEYEEINLLPFQSTLEPQLNVAYQRPSELQEYSDFPVYEIIN